MPSNKDIQKYLESMKWVHGEFMESAFETISIREFQKKDFAWANIIIPLLQKKQKIGEYRYRIRSRSMIRTSGKIKIKIEGNPLVKLSAKFMIRIKKLSKEGLVTKVE